MTPARFGFLRAWLGWGSTFDPARPNNFDLLRFAAATLVLVDHSHALTGRAGGPGPFYYETPASFAVAVFFLISGFLVTASWERTPEVRIYAMKRALRILPAFVVVIVASALVLGPAVTVLPLGDYFGHHRTWIYFLNLTFLRVVYALPGVYAGNPFPDAVNGSIWTLPIELAMYALLALLGRNSLANRPGVTALVAVLGIVWFGWGTELYRAPALVVGSLPAAYTVHLGLWFFIGSAYWLWRERIRYRWDVAAALLVMLSMTEGTREGLMLFHAAIPYLVFAVARLPVRWMNEFGRRGDFSYGIYLYAFPVQQTVTWAGGASWMQAIYVVVCFGVTLACAVASWGFVEHPALRKKRRVLDMPSRRAV